MRWRLRPPPRVPIRPRRQERPGREPSGRAPSGQRNRDGGRGRGIGLLPGPTRPRRCRSRGEPGRALRNTRPPRSWSAATTSAFVERDIVRAARERRASSSCSCTRRARRSRAPGASQQRCLLHVVSPFCGTASVQGGCPGAKSASAASGGFLRDMADMAIEGRRATGRPRASYHGARVPCTSASERPRSPSRP